MTVEEVARRQFVEAMRTEGFLRLDAVEAALLSVDRTRFAPGRTPGEVYGTGSVVTETGADGRPTSAVSAGWLQAAMLEAAGLRPGMRAVEIGSGGYNASLMSRLVGPSGHVLSVDISPSVLERAQAGMADQVPPPENVSLLLADAWAPGALDPGPIDALLATVDVWDLPWGLADRVREGGTVVVPMHLDGLGVCLGLARSGDALVGTITTAAGFVPASGRGRRTARDVPDGAGATVLSSSAPSPMPADRLDAVVGRGPTVARTGVLVGDVTITELFLWILSHGRRTAMWASASGTRVEGFTGLSPLGTPAYLAADRGFAALAVDRQGGLPFELTVVAYGEAEGEAGELVQVVREWEGWTAAGSSAEIQVQKRSDPSSSGSEHPSVGWSRCPDGWFELDEGRPETVVRVRW